MRKRAEYRKGDYTFTWSVRVSEDGASLIKFSTLHGLTYSLASPQELAALAGWLMSVSVQIQARKTHFALADAGIWDASDYMDDATVREVEDF